MGYLFYYLLWFGLSYALANPWLLVGFAFIYVAQQFVPDPVVWLRAWRRIARLRTDIGINPANVTARRELAFLLLERGRVTEADRVLDEALARLPNDAELLILRGRARLSLGRHDQALDSIGRALEIDASIGHGDPYLLAGDAHRAKGRLDQAIAAYEHAIEENHSSVVGHARLASAFAARGDREAAARVRGEASRLYGQLPSYLRRQQRGAYVRMKLASLVG